MIVTSHRLRRPAAAFLTVPVLLLTACSGGGGVDEPSNPEDVLAEAKTQLDETSGVTLGLTAEDLPPDLSALVDATGTGTHAPAFEGTVEVQVNNLTLEVPVVAVEGQVFAKLPGLTKHVEIEPGDYGAPDPAALMDSTNGLSAWLTSAKDVEEGDQTRDGEAVLTTYTGTLPGTAVVEVIPSADRKADFDATFSIDDEGRLAEAEVTGPFYGKGGDVTYAVTIDDYGTEADITRP